MSIYGTTTIPCPNCGTDIDITIYDLVNKHEDPELASKIINGTFFMHTCKSCGAEILCTYPLVYRDFEAKIVLMLSEYSNELMAAEVYFTDIENQTGRLDYQVRLCENAIDFEEKARIFDHRMDDRHIEIMKLVALAVAREQGLDCEVKHMTCWFLDDDIYFMLTDGEETYTLKTEKSAYEFMKKECEIMLAEENKNFFHVDMGWAVDFLGDRGLEV